MKSTEQSVVVHTKVLQCHRDGAGNNFILIFKSVKSPIYNCKLHLPITRA